MLTPNDPNQWGFRKLYGVCLFLGVCLLAACAHTDIGVGVEFHWENLDKIKLGMTAEEIQKILGKPSSIVVDTGKADKETYDYSYMTSSSFGTIGLANRNRMERKVHLVFNKGVLEEYTFENRAPK